MGLDDKIRNESEDVAGKAKEAAGKVTDDERLEAEGKGDQMKADLKQKLDRAVSAGRITKSDETKVLNDADQRITNLVKGKIVRPARPEGWFGHRDEFGARPGTGYQGPPAA